MQIDYNEFDRVKWIENAVLYEVNTRQFTEEGTFAALMPHLQRLKNMGVDIVWFMPITPISELAKKGTMGSPYACASYTAINPQLGSLQDFKTLVKTAHTIGLKVIIDWVANHTGWEHEWIKTHPAFHKRDLHGNVYPLEGMEDIIGLDFDNDAMQDAMIEAMRFWVTETDIDGFRCDLADWVRLSFWQKARRTLEKTKPMFWLAESDFLDSPDFMTVFDAAYTWKWMHKSRDFADGKKNYEEFINQIWQYDAVQKHGKIPLWFTTNHDENSWNGTEYEKYGDKALMLAAFTFTWNGMPLLYTGQEIPNHKRLHFFDKDALAWPENLEMEGFYKKLCDLKHRYRCLAASVPDVETVVHKAENEILIFERRSREDGVFCLYNFSKIDYEFVNDTALQFYEYEEIFSSERLKKRDGRKWVVAPNGFLIFRSVPLLV